jgi:hypothetical protein
LRDPTLDLDYLRRVVFQQVLDVVVELSTWIDGRFSFHPAPDLAPPAISFNPQNVLLEVARLADERKKAALPSEEDR